MLDSYHYYTDLVMEISILEFQLKSAISEREDWNFWGGRLGRTVPLDVAAEKMDKLADRIEWLGERLDEKKALRRSIDEKLNSFEGLEHRVAYLRIVEKMTLEEIAEELGYSVDWIKKVSAKVRRHFEGTDILNLLF